MIIYEDWIRSHLPPEYADMDVSHSGFYMSGLCVMAEGERGGDDIVVYRAENEEDLKRWAFESVCKLHGSRAQLEHRTTPKKWRFYRDHAENGKWLYIEHRNYDYNAIHDSRLDNFEGYLRLIKPVLSPELWEKRIDEYTHLINYWYNPPHWAYDREKLCFIEIANNPNEINEDLNRQGAIIKIVD